MLQCSRNRNSHQHCELAKITGEKGKQSFRKSKTANKPNVIKAKVKRNKVSYGCNTQLRGAAEKGSHTDTTSTENSDPENKFAMYHRHSVICTM